MKINKYHPMGDIYLFKMLIPLIETHVFLFNRKTKERTPVFMVETTL